MKRIITLIALLIFTLSLHATTYTYTCNVGPNNTWQTAANWSPSYPGATINAGDSVIVKQSALFFYCRISPSFTVNINGVLVIDNFVNIGLLGNLIIGSNGVIANKGHIGLYQNSQMDIYGLLSSSSGAPYESTIDLDPMSNLEIFPTGELSTTDTITVNTNSQVTVNGLLTNDGYIINQGSINGIGSIVSGLTMANGNIVGSGTVAPGLSPGELKTDFDYQLPAAGTLEIELGGLIPGTEYDVLGGTGDKTLAGHLDIKNYNGFMASAGDAFEIIKGDNITGTFDSVTYPPLSGSAVWKLFYETDKVVLAAVYPLDITSYSTQDISIYPNPTKGQLFINGSEEMKYFVIRNSLGQIVQSGNIENNFLQISTINTGLYFVELQDEGKNKIVKSVYLK